MGNQLNFYLDIADYDDFVDPFISDYRLVVLDANAGFLSVAKVIGMGVEPLNVYLTTNDLLSQIVLSGPKNNIDVLRSPVIEFSRPFQNDEIIRRGRFYISSGFYNEDEVWVPQNEEITKIYSKLARRTRSKLEKATDCFASAKALSWLKDKECRKFSAL